MTGKTREEILAGIVMSISSTELERAVEKAGFSVKEALDVVWDIQNEQS